MGRCRTDYYTYCVVKFFKLVTKPLLRDGVIDIIISRYEVPIIRDAKNALGLRNEWKISIFVRNSLCMLVCEFKYIYQLL